MNVFDEETLSKLGGPPARSSRFPDYSPEIMPPWDRLCALKLHDPIRPSLPTKDWPEHLKHGDDRLQMSIMWKWHVAEISNEDEWRIEHLLEQLSEAVNMQLGGYEARQRALDPLAEKRFVVDVFGSMSWGGQTGKGDIDLVIRVGEGDIVRFVVTAS
jgi:predicted nucleotidyltransferase